MHKRNKGHTNRREILKIKLTKELREFMENSDEESESMKDVSEESESVKDTNEESESMKDVSEEIVNDSSDKPGENAKSTKGTSSKVVYESSCESDEVSGNETSKKSEDDPDMVIFHKKQKKRVKKTLSRKRPVGTPLYKEITSKKGETITLKWCVDHQHYHPINNFYFMNKALGKYDASCKECMSARKKKNRTKTRETELKRRYTYGPTKVCDGELCRGKERPIKMFTRRSRVTGQREGLCRDCIKFNPGRNPEKRKQQVKRTYHERGGKEKAKIYQEGYKPRRNARNRERRKTDVDYRIKQTIRSRIYDCFRRAGIQRKGKNKYLGINGNMYIKWLEFQFDDNMLWNNQGSYWHIDHVKPCDSYKFTNEDDEAIYECFNWANTRPMEVNENLEKSSRVDLKLIKQHQKVVEAFKKKHPKYFAKENN